MTDKELIAKLVSQVEYLTKRVKELEARLSKYENPKNSTNSSTAPSQDPYRKTKSLRVKSTKKPGGQNGHKGSRLEMVTNPDKVVLHDIASCTYCGEELSNNAQDFESRQVFDLPDIKIEVTEHRVLKKTCSCCGKLNKGHYPKAVTQLTQYGTRIKGLCVYLQNYQMLPYSRCAELIEDLIGHKLSTGSLSNFQQESFVALETYEQEIKKLLLQSKVLHADETGIRFNGSNSWMHVISNKTISFFSHHLKRGKQAMDDIGLLKNYNGTLVHDRFSSYFSYQCEHSLCNAHILRDLTYVEERFEADWAKQIKALLIRAKIKKDKNPNILSSYYSRVFNKYIKLIRPVIQHYDKQFKKTDEQRLAFALEKHKYLFLKFIKQPQLPFDNNQAERDLRMIKVKQKVSGCFRSQNYAKYFARIRGYIATAKKNKQNVLDTIKNAFELKPFIPQATE